MTRLVHTTHVDTPPSARPVPAAGVFRCRLTEEVLVAKGKEIKGTNMFVLELVDAGDDPS